MLDLAATRPALYVASAAGASVVRALEKIYTLEPSIRVIDAHPLNGHDPAIPPTWLFFIVLGNPHIRRGRLAGVASAPLRDPLALAAVGRRRRLVARRDLLPYRAPHEQTLGLFSGGGSPGTLRSGWRSKV